jgi:hypothetical protein
MRNESRRGRCTLLALLVIAAAGGAGAQESPQGTAETTGAQEAQAAQAAPETRGVESIFPALSSALPAEAPTSIFNAKLGSGPDADAELLMSGTWTSTIIASVVTQASPGENLSSSSAQPFLFTQEPDLALSFLLYKRIFVEAKVSQKVSEAKYAAGYRGQDDELVREVRIGNDGINFPALPFLSFGDGSYRSFGASALIGNDSFAGKAMVRYDQASRVTKRFVGSTEVIESVLSPNGFVTGKYFMTERAPGGRVLVYVQSSAGSLEGSDGKKYRRLESDEYSYSSATGVVSLAAAASTRVLASYSGSGSGSGAVTIAGVGACDFLYDPPSEDHDVVRIYPRLQVLCRYATSATASSGEAFVRNEASGLRDSAYEAAINDLGYIEVTRPGRDAAGARSAGVPDAYRRPFGDSSGADMEWIYETDFACDAEKIGIAPVFTRSVVLRSFSSSSQITIDKDYVAGSVEVTRNGVPDYAFTVDAESGIVSLASPPAAAEEIVITYLRESDERKTGLVMGALGGFWDLGSGRSAWTALGAAWSIPGSSYSAGGDTSPGSINLTGGLKDAEGELKSEAATALRYSRDDATGIYRIEGMESTTEYRSTFRPLTAGAAFVDAETSDDGLKSEFPDLVKSFHKDGSSQKALRIVSDGSPTIAVYKILDAPLYPSYKTFAFFARLPPGASLTVKLDDGSASSPESLSGASAGIAVPEDPTRKGDWDRYLVHYGDGDSDVYSQDDEDASERRVTGASSRSPKIKSTGSRLVVSISGLAKGEEAWIDEIVLEDSVGRMALIFQGKLSYDDPKLVLGKAEDPIVSGVKADAFAEGAVDSDPYAAGGASVAASLGFLGLGLRARTSVADKSASFSGGHSIALPDEGFPIAVKDDFDYNASSGAFGRTDSVELRGGGIASLSAKQTSDWTPDSSIAESGVLVQSWNNSLVFGPSYLTLGLDAKNRSLPSETPGSADGAGNYAAAWIGAFRYALPAFESSSDLREAKGSLSVKAGPGEFLAASLGETTTPESGEGGMRSDAASIRLALPFSAFGLSLEPYYSRGWKAQLNESEEGLVEDARAAMGDIAEAPLLYRSVPFKEFFSAETSSDFEEETAPDGAALPYASYSPEAGVKMARESGSMPIDLVAPDVIALSFGRSLTRQDDALNDAAVWTVSSRCSAVNVFGSLGTTPLGLPFDSDEYMSTLQADLSLPRDGSASSYDILYHGLSTFYAGAAQANRFDAESKLSLAALPSGLNWSGSLALSLSRRLERHWLLAVYQGTIGAPTPMSGSETLCAGEEPDSSIENEPVKEPAITSYYLQDLRSREPVMRSTWGLTGGLSGVRSDAADYQPGWLLAETYEAKLTIPERLTIAVNLALNQSVDASTRILTVGYLVSLGLTVSF